MHRALASLFALVALLLPSAAWACPVCGQGRPGSESALLVMSGILSALPLLMAGGIVAWVLVRVRAAAHEPVDGTVEACREAERPPGAPSAPYLATSPPAPRRDSGR